MGSRLIVVTGATGKQGKALVKAERHAGVQHIVQRTVAHAETSFADFRRQDPKVRL
ncbi:MAG: hypothetical protein KDE31_23655 [Caldilineaceae bacterium]|nr:hypothetical protein [Caldilineaceae bacterium]